MKHEIIDGQKWCSSCEKYHDISEFYVSKAYASGLQPTCKECCRLKNTEYRSNKRVYCHQCEEYLPVEEFYRGGTRVKHKSCNTCHNRVEKFKEKEKEKKRKIMEKRKYHRTKEYKNLQLWKKFRKYLINKYDINTIITIRPAELTEKFKLSKAKPTIVLKLAVSKGLLIADYDIIDGQSYWTIREIL